MTTTQNCPIVAIFPSRGRAESAIDELLHARFRHDQLGVAMPGRGVTEPHTATDAVEEKAATGASRGAIAGGAIGAILGAAALAVIPGIGPVLAGGTLLGIATGVVGAAATGAATGALVGPFIAMGLSEDEARYYQGELAAGRTVLTVQAGEREEIVLSILRNHGATEIRTPATCAATSKQHGLIDEALTYPAR